MLTITSSLRRGNRIGGRKRR